MTADRELRAETTIDAPPDQVWAVLSDLDRMPELSTELVRMVPLMRGGLKLGQQYLGLNRRNWVFWPTRSKVVSLEPARTLAWHTASSGATWIYELSPVEGGTHVVHRRPVPKRITLLSRGFAPLFLGGSEGHADELEQHLGQTLARLKAVVEGTPAPV
jgi:uncharacterized protein YndB with AHSA1/START domain